MLAPAREQHVALPLKQSSRKKKWNFDVPRPNDLRPCLSELVSCLYPRRDKAFQSAGTLGRRYPVCHLYSAVSPMEERIAMSPSSSLGASRNQAHPLARPAVVASHQSLRKMCFFAFPQVKILFLGHFLVLNQGSGGSDRTLGPRTNGAGFFASASESDGT